VDAAASEAAAADAALLKVQQVRAASGPAAASHTLGAEPAAAAHALGALSLLLLLLPPRRHCAVAK
jgi:hypothetical protein